MLIAVPDGDPVLFHHRASPILVHQSEEVMADYELLRHAADFYHETFLNQPLFWEPVPVSGTAAGVL
jgi:hypothetical protein